jgi:alpha-1,3-rhamnosyl/mannosyltransferase
VPLCLFVLDIWPWDPPKSSGLTPENPRRARRACQDARGIVAPSEYVRRRCLELFDAPLDKMIVAPPGVESVLGEPHRSIVEPPYIVVAGNTCPSHNHARVLDACNLLSVEFPHTLVAAGEACTGEPAAWGPNVVRIERCPGAQLAGLYQNAAAVIIPDLHQGSGHHVLEALATGALVIAPKLDAIPECSGGHVLYYNHESTESLRRVIRRVLEEPPGPPTERQRAARRAREFTWERCAWKVASVFKRVAP